MWVGVRSASKWLVIPSRDNYNYSIPEEATKSLLDAAAKLRPF